MKALEIKYPRLEDWIENLQAKGKNAFSLSQVKEAFNGISDDALHLSLSRYRDKNKILSILRGYYLIISPKYAAMKIIPPVNFIDGLMKSLDRPYYVGLLSAASMQGASHQQPQEFFVFTDLPAMRSINKNGIKINFISIVSFPKEETLEKVKTEVGYLNISPAPQTILDLIYFEDRVGGLSRASTVISELVENVSPSQFSNKLLARAKYSTLQRLGYLLEEVIDKKNIADGIYKFLRDSEIHLSKIPLDSSCKKEGFEVNKKWNLIINTTIELD